MRAKNVAGNWQAEAGAAGFTVSAFLDTVEWIDNAFELVGRNTGAVILDGDGG